MLETENNREERPLTTENLLSWRYWLGETDTRWLAIFRILLCIVLLKDAIYHLFLARIWYSDSGVLPRSALFDGLVRDYRFSLMDAIGLPEFAFAFFLLWIIVLMLLMLGYRVRLMACLNFLLLLSVHERNPYVLTAADTLLRTMSFWLIFAPIGQHYSLDALWRKQSTDYQNNTAFALPMRLIQWQLIIIYLCTAYLKMIGPIWKSGEIMNYVVQLDTILLPFGEWMRSWSPELLQLASYFALFAEIAIPILLLMPIFWRSSRILAFLLAIGLHGGIALTMAIPDFSIVMLICYLPFFDPAWLIWLESRLKLPALSFERIAFLYPKTWQGYRLSLSNQRALLVYCLLPLFVSILWWNVAATSEYNDENYVEAPNQTVIPYPPTANLMRLIGIWQYWDMFSPLPIQYDGWIVIEGEFENGDSYELVTGLPLDESIPLRWYGGPDMRWEKWEENNYRNQDAAMLGAWAAYYCRSYGANPYGERLATMEIRIMLRWSHAPDEAPNSYESQLLWYHWCYDDYAPQG